MPATLLYQGHASLRITTGEGKVIYVDPYAGEGYDLPADLILVTHQHPDHNQLRLIEQQNPDCTVITNTEALEGGRHQSFDLGYVAVEATYAANQNHSPDECVGFILTFSDGATLYLSGDTSTTDQMKDLAARRLDYAFFCCDGRYNMDVAEASAAAALVAARHSIPYHMQAGALDSPPTADAFDGPGKLVLRPGDTLELVAGG